VTETTRHQSRAVFDTSGGGTARGVEGKVESDVSGVSDVSVDEFPNRSPPTVDVVVDGGSDGAVIEAINNARPVGIEHDLVRPERINTGVRVEVIGSNVDNSFVETQLRDTLTQLSIGDELSRSRLTQLILNADNNIRDIGSLTVALESVVGESQLFASGTNVYPLDVQALGDVTADKLLFRENVTDYELLYDDVTASSVTVQATVDGNTVELVQGTDYSVVDSDGDGAPESIKFLSGGQSPDIQSTFTVSYTHNSASVADTITDESGQTFDRGVDYTVVDADNDGLVDAIDWSVGGTSPAAGDLFFVDYDAKKVIARDKQTTSREKISAGDLLTVSSVVANQ